MSKLQDLRPVSHKDCSVQYLGRDFSLGIAGRVYQCFTHGETFKLLTPISKPKSKRLPNPKNK